MMKLHILGLIICLVPFSCNSTSKKVPSFDDFPYDLNNPDQVFKLKNDLEEISALTYWEGSKLACVQDEDGLLFIFDARQGEVISEYHFGKDGDYEGVEIIGNKAYVLRSDGTLYEISDFSGKSSSSKSYKTPLSTKNDTEGLAFEPYSNSLLIACKEQSLIDKKSDHQRAVYQFDLKTKTFNPKPYLIIDEKLLSDIAQEKVTFHPSGISIHPKTQERYIIASKGSSLAVLDPDGNITDVKSLPNKIFKQPEGICFMPDGTLYISNEGRDGKGNILCFKYRKEMKN